MVGHGRLCGDFLDTELHLCTSEPYRRVSTGEGRETEVGDDGLDLGGIQERHPEEARTELETESKGDFGVGSPI